MAEEKTQESIQKPKEGEKPTRRGLSRRNFLQIGGRLGAQLLLYDLICPFLDPSYPSISKGLSKNLFNFTLGLSKEDIAKLHQKFEERFYIDLVNPDEQHSVNVRIYRPNEDQPEEKDVPTVSWNGPELVTLAVGLDNLPRRMYIPGRYYDQKTRFVLLGKMPDTNPDPNYSTAAFCRCSHETGMVVVGKETFPTLPPLKSASYSRLTHELAHKVVASDQLDLGELGKLISIVGDRELEYIFRKPPSQYTKEMRRALRSARDEYVSLRYGGTNFDEFVAVGAEIYKAGKEKFLNIYTPFIKDDKAIKLYSWLKEKIFFNSEYDPGRKLIKVA